MDTIQALNEYFQSKQFINWFNEILEMYGYVTEDDVIRHAKQDGIIPEDMLYGSSLYGWAYPIEESKEES